MSPFFDYRYENDIITMWQSSITPELTTRLKQPLLVSQDSRLLYYLISEIKTWLNINHITVHNNTLVYILKLKEQLLKIQKLNKNKLVIYVIYTHARTHTHTHTDSTVFVRPSHAFSVCFPVALV